MADLVLSVENSLMQESWVSPPFDQDMIERIVRQHDLPEIIARLLNARDIAPEQIETFLNPTLKDHFPDPLSLKGMNELAGDLAQAVIDKRKIGIFADFDVDGATSTAILVRFFRHLGRETPFYIPDRLAEGYGPNIKAFETLKKQGAEIVLICDCGITAFDVITEGRKLGLELVVLDHHEAEDKLPDANHIINPKRKDDTSGLDMLAACGVVFLVCVAVNTRLREKGWYKAEGIEEAPLKNVMDLLALGTICDMVPLTGVNRLFVKTGFAQMARLDNPGIRALCEVAKVNDDPTPFTAGFVLGPRINAGSRVHKAYLGAQMLSTDDAEEALNTAWVLNDCNDKRKDIESTMLDKAISIVEQQALHEHPIIIVDHEDFHPGLSGLVAGRLKEKYKKPACLITYATLENGAVEGRGSGRSIPGINMGAAFIDARNEGILLKGGGHAMAAGFSLLPERLEDFREFLFAHINKQAQGLEAVTQSIIDGVLSVRGAQPDLVRIIHDNIGPFGTDNPEPLFVFPNVRLHMVDIVGKDHVRCMISDWEGGPRLKAIAFRSADTKLGEALLKHGQSQPFHIAGHLKLNYWNDRESVEMHIRDAAFAMEGTAAELLTA